jgi:hypothetical protein
VPVDERDYAREPDGPDDPYFSTMVGNGWLSGIRRLVGGKPAAPFVRKPSRAEVERELQNWSEGGDTKPLY